MNDPLYDSDDERATTQTHRAGKAAAISRPQAGVDIVLALVLTVAGAVAAPLLGHVLIQRLGWQVPLLAVLLLQGVVILAGIRLLLGWRGQHWRQIGFLPLRGKDLLLGLGALLLVFGLNAAFSAVGSQLSPDLVDAHRSRLAEFAGLLTGHVSLPAIAAAMLFTGFYEEVLARGFLLARCRALLPGYWPPVLLSSVLFGLGHFYQGWLGVVQTTLLGVLFAALVLRWGTLWPVILAHAALNTLSLVVLRSLGVHG